MGGGVSKPVELAALPAAGSSEHVGPPGEAGRKNSKHRDMSKQPKKAATAIDGRIVQTLRGLCLKRRAVNVKGMNFERIALKFGLAREAFETIQCIYDRFASEQKGGLDYDGLKAALGALGAQMDEKDMREIFYESDMVRDNNLSKNEFVVSLAISYLLGLIMNFDHLSHTMMHATGTAVNHSTADDANDSGVHTKAAETTETAPPMLSHGTWTSNGEIETPRESLSACDTSVFFPEGSPQVIAKALELMVNAYLLFDDDASGTIQVNEVRNIMRKHNSTAAKLQRMSSGMMSKSIQIERIKELDVDQDGTITFQEFVLTFQKWVSSDDDDDDGGD